jgi:FkbM family methyltransferase
MKIIRKLADIPRGVDIALFGAGQAGINMLRILQDFRPDLSVRCFIDSFKSGIVKDLPVINLPGFLNLYLQPPLILIVSLSWREIEKHIVEYNISRYLVVPPRFFVSSGYNNLTRNSSLPPVENPLFRDLFHGEQQCHYKEQLEQTASLLHVPGDRELFHILTHQIKANENRIDAISAYYYYSSLQRQYFDFIDYSHIHTIIEGGVANGNDTAAFVEAMPDGGCVYGFEPNIQDYYSGIYKSQLDKNPNVTILPKGLWSHETSLYFKISGLSSRILEHIPEEDEHGAWQSIDVTSIDQWVQSQNIKKVDFIKMDIEGAELDALHGAVNTLKRDRPQLAICLYHKAEHFFQIPLFLKETLDYYEFRIGHYTAGALETVFYGKPERTSA